MLEEVCAPPGRQCTEMVLVATFHSNVSVGAADEQPEQELTADGGSA